VETIGRDGRIAGIAGVVLVHVLLIAFLLSGLPASFPAARTAREIVLLLIPKPKPKSAAPAPREKHPPVVTAVPQRPMPYRAPVTAPPLAPPAAEGLRIPLLRCSPESLAMLSPEEHAACKGFAPPPADAVAGFRSHVRDPERRAAELAARQTPVRVDCATMKSRVIDNIAQDHGVFVDVGCEVRLIRHALGR
jgi:hypothetical protein